MGDADVALIPIISGGRALKLLLSAWKRRYNRAPDAIIVEGPLCGGHLGFLRMSNLRTMRTVPWKFFIRK